MKTKPSTTVQTAIWNRWKFTPLSSDSTSREKVVWPGPIAFGYLCLISASVSSYVTFAASSSRRAEPRPESDPEENEHRGGQIVLAGDGPDEHKRHDREDEPPGSLRGAEAVRLGLSPRDRLWVAQNAPFLRQAPPDI